MSRPSAAQEEDEIALAVSKRIKEASSRASKHSIQRSGPLRAPSSSQARAGEKQWLQQCQELYQSLPQNSKWAKHKLKVLSQAIAILEKAAADRTADEAAQLQKLLSTLNIGPKRPTARPAHPAAAAGGAAVGGSAAADTAAAQPADDMED